MGLLDDAIREHLELKRRRGADPGEVAREQREVLDTPAQATDRESLVGDTTGATAHPDVGLDEQPLESEPADASAGLVKQAQAPGETAELDMRSVLGEGDAQDGVPTAAHPAGEPASPPPSPDDEDSLEWEVPGESAQAEQDELDEDVLEETPDFLRDTPEQERLWFEQRPPRDFDFDK